MEGEGEGEGEGGRVHAPLGLTRQNRPVKLSVGRDLDKAHVGRQLTPGAQIYYVTRHDFAGDDSTPYSVAAHKTVFWQHGGDAGHDAAARPVLPSVEGCLDEEDSQQHDGQGKVRDQRRLAQWLPRYKDEDRANE